MHRDLALSIDLQLHAFRDAMAYFEVCVRPFLVGCAIPNQPRPLNEAEWAQLPRIMQHALVYAVSSHRVSRGQAEGEMGKVVLRRLHEHRGRALALLRGHLGLLEEGEEEEDAGTWTQPKQGAIQLGGKAKWRAPGWSGLVLITMMLGNEVQLSAFGKQGWKWHFEAAWKCVDMLDGGLRGGPPGLGGERLAALEKSYKHGIEPELACTYLLQIEVLSATTTPIWKLERREGVREALGEGILEGLEDRILISSCPCPLSVLRALAEINDLRIGLYRRRYETVAIPDDLMGCGSEEVSKRLWDILTTLLCFDANAWANQVYERHYTKLPPSSDALTPRDTWQHYWATAARCYHSAAVVYLVRAFQSNHLKSPLLRECAETTAVLLDEHRQTLSDGLKFLTEDSSAADPVERAPRLWRFISWPLFVDAYNAVSWPDVGGLVDLGKMRIDRLTTLGRHMGVNAMLDAVVALEEVQFGRKHTWSWQWDDGFQDRCIFAL
ncbi:uncharacterized protein HMPREF1541_05550 [Cyphellophora europaea CBS 101466]|uniref:Transcription factor domain-containing protein n=1 Tax=Cyphellophora europaea (strain CBS 101466) TaxID=1220924 RepID=W2RS96_CYPE1|nr:uncharacterized protein HMPREF1541_05550 [Cyphellophora europaea CBS 101466]ETN39327.1 hypothetical protein HMPREF1541_05550 [Cyphellophora europaea CBS 101466]